MPYDVKWPRRNGRWLTLALYFFVILALRHET